MEKRLSKKTKQNRLHPAIEETYIVLGTDAYGMTTSDYKLRNRLKNRLAKVRSRSTLERIAQLLEVTLD